MSLALQQHVHQQKRIRSTRSDSVKINGEFMGNITKGSVREGSGPNWLFLTFGLLLLLTGAALAIGGAYLAYLGGSWYYLLAGVGLAVCGKWLASRKAAAIALFLPIYVLTIIWALWESGLNFWAQVPRIGPFLVIGLILGLLWARLGSNQRKAGYSMALVNLAVLVAGVWGMFQPHDVIVGSAPAQEPVAKGVPFSHSIPGDWSAYGRDQGGTHYAPIGQITPQNVNRLKVAWTFNTQEIHDSADLEATPLQIGNSLYVCTAHNRIFSIDATTGKENWSFDPKVKAEGSWNRCRGVGYFDADKAAGVSAADVSANAAQGQQCRQRVIATTVDANLLALDAKTGELCKDFGSNGVVDQKVGMGANTPVWYFSTSAPLVAGNHIIVGGRVADNRSADEPGGVVRAYSAQTGELLWAWDPGRKEGEGSKAGPYVRSTPNFWGTATYDEKLGLVFIPTGNGTPDHWGEQRTPETDRYSTAVVALHVNTGKVAWVYQTVHHDLWDWDLAAPPTFADMPDGKGGSVPAIIQVGKAGQIFVLNRATGEPLTEVVERPVPQNVSPKQRLSPTQPYSVGMPQVIPNNFSEKTMWGATFFDQLMCRIAYRKLNYEGQYTPPSLTPTAITPSYLGGFNWGGVAIDPIRNLLILNDVRMTTIMTLIPRDVADASNYQESGHDLVEHHLQKGTPYGLTLESFTSPLGVPCEEPSWGKITAIDLNTRQIAWQIPAGTLEATAKEMVGVGFNMPIGMPTVSAAITTASGVTFYSGFLDERVRAWDSSTGKELWSEKMPVGSQSTPMTYVSPENGKQYLVIVAGGSAHSSNVGDHIIAYALPDGAEEMK
ncbi:membrane-bound PQQ-dependent dehydrogenase, glucose/quinate/shikimate family [Pseudomonas monteilii]|uniref:membrane-bound PQQ-dependent dehydrogenase, glucose/quinate/shikimate family n=1 Tax=Pseudomonas monteilii TaxID=76759 RepID=UPI003CFD2739